MYTITINTLWRHAAEMFMNDLIDDYGYEITRTVSDDGIIVSWKLVCSEINEKKEAVISRLYKRLTSRYWFLNIE